MVANSHLAPQVPLLKELSALISTEISAVLPLFRQDECTLWRNRKTNEQSYLLWKIVAFCGIQNNCLEVLQKASFGLLSLASSFVECDSSESHTSTKIPG